MSEPRPKIPADIAREVRVEAGHRCAIPTCRGTSALEIHHIEDYAKVQKHEFHNLILLCAVCHHRATIKDIDRLSMKHYKANLGTLNGRYGEFERRILHAFAEDLSRPYVRLADGLEMQVWYLLRDGLIEEISNATARQPMIIMKGQPTSRFYRLTSAGREVVSKLVKASPLEEENA